MMLLPKPLIIKQEMDAHAHAAEHDDIHNEKSIPLQEKPLSSDPEAKPLLPTPGQHVDHEKLV